jgi:8-oxo-dGTP pyrophosphatase MutT (NUDIX family)
MSTYDVGFRVVAPLGSGEEQKQTNEKQGVEHMHDTIPNGARLASRIILIGPNQTVLYLLAHEPQSKKRIWVMPGGGLDGDETFEDAAKRELCEETGCAFTLGPCVWVRHHYVWNGKKRDQYERFFVAHTETLILNPKEQDGYVSGHKWWSLDELRSSSEEFAPRSVAKLLPDILHGIYPNEPIDCGV